MATNDSRQLFRRCAYISTCYIAEAAQCSGYKKDCPLYRETNGEVVDGTEFHAAMDQLIAVTRKKHQERSEKV